MTEYCKHGIDMASTCRKCGRTKVVEVPNFKAKKDGFINSIDRLEETIRKMHRELAEDPVAYRQPAAAREAVPDPEIESGPVEENPTPSAPPDRFPWQRR
jgi:hypothetical protein